MNDSQTFEVREKLASLEETLLKGTPNMPTLLRDIHRNLKNDPDIVTILSDEECSVLVKGLCKQTKTVITTSAIKKTKSKSNSKVTLADL